MSSMYIGMDSVLLNLDQVQHRFQNTVTQLSSGLRVNTAADDPSGYAIATNLQSKTLGLQQSAQNVQNANNALNVATGALTQVQTILERVNTLIVQANSDINSSADLQDIQTEINQLLTEINTIGEKTSFNGLNLLNGQFDTSPGTGSASLTQVTSPFGGSPLVTNYNGLGQAGKLITNANVAGGSGYFAPSLLVFTVVGYSDNAVDPDSGTNIGPGVYLQFDAYSSNSTFATAPLFQDTSAVPINSGQIGPVPFTNAPSTYIYLNATISNLTAADVGSSIAFYSQSATNPGGGTALSVNDGGDEGTTVGFSLPTINTNALGLSNVTVLDPVTDSIIPGSLNVAQNATNSSNNLAASYSEIAVKNALTQVTTAQAQIGAQAVALNIDFTNDNTAAVNYQQSSSDITDLNVGQATTEFTQQQILVNVGTSVLSQLQQDTRATTALLITALVA